MEQAKSLLNGVVETTLGNAELKRLIANAEAQIKLGQNEVFSTIDTIIHEYPKDYNGYLLYIKATLQIIKKTKKIYISLYFQSKYGGGRVSLEKCREMYLNLLKLSEDNEEISSQQLEEYWESSFQDIYRGLKCGDITGLDEARSTYDLSSHPLLTKAEQEAKDNCNLLKQNGIYIEFLGRWDENGYCIIDFTDIDSDNVPYFILGKEIIFSSKDAEDGRGIIPSQYIPINEHIDEIVSSLDEKYNRCPKCHVRLENPFLSKKYKCPKCGEKY